MSEQKQPPRLYIEDSGVPPPTAPTVDHEHKVVLFTADGKPLVRKAGF